jgi:hypothetical protein
MRTKVNEVFLILLIGAFVLLPCHIKAQQKPQRELKLYDNVKVIEVSDISETQKKFNDEYQRFLPLFEKVLKNITANWPAGSELTVRVALGVKKVGSAKIQRPFAEVTAFRKESKREFVGTLLLYSYVTRGPVNSQEIEQFLNRQIIGPIKRSVRQKP